MKIVFDNIIFSWQKSGGISVVWYELLNRIIKQHGIECCFLEYRNKELNICRKKLSLNHNVFQNKSFMFFCKKYLNPRINSKEKFLFHSSYYRTCSNRQAINITTVHDFTYEYFNSGIKKRIHCWQKYKAIRNSDYIICISENTKKDLLKFLPDINEERIRVIYNGVSDCYYPLESKSEEELPFPAFSYLLFVGSREKYKKFELAVKAIAASDYNLLIVGAPLLGEEKDFLDLKLKGRYKALGRVNNECLNVIYNYAFALLYPSLYEGFGIPVIEAQKAGCPVIAYNSSSISEIIGETPLLLNELSVETILDGFDILSQNIQREKIIKDGLMNAQYFTWDKMYEQVLDLYKVAWDAKI